MWLGAHIGIAEGLAEAPKTGRRIGCEAIQIFSKSPHMWAGPGIAPEAAKGFRAAVQTEALRATSIHHGYLANLASPKKPMLARSRKAFLDELQRAESLGVDHLIFHPGAHLGSGQEEGLRVLVQSLDLAFEKTSGFRVRVLLENSAGQGSSVASTFRDLAEVLAKLGDPARAGVAIDTCHLFASGVDFRDPSTYGATVDRLDAELGRANVRAFHLNDAKADLGSHLDRHENIGRGLIGLEGFRGWLNDPRWASVPGYLETPIAEGDEEYATYRADLASLRSLLPASAGSESPSPGAPRSVSRPTPK